MKKKQYHTSCHIGKGDVAHIMTHAIIDGKDRPVTLCGRRPNEDDCYDALSYEHPVIETIARDMVCSRCWGLAQDEVTT